MGDENLTPIEEARAYANLHLTVDCPTDAFTSEKKLAGYIKSLCQIIDAQDTALREIASANVPDQPMSNDISERNWLLQHHTELRRIATKAIATRPTEGK